MYFQHTLNSVHHNKTSASSKLADTIVPPQTLKTVHQQRHSPCKCYSYLLSQLQSEQKWIPIIFQKKWHEELLRWRDDPWECAKKGDEEGMKRMLQRSDVKDWINKKRSDDYVSES